MNEKGVGDVEPKNEICVVEKDQGGDVQGKVSEFVTVDDGDPWSLD